MIPSVALNGVSVITVWKCPQLKQKISHFLLMMQSVTDLTVGLVSLPALGILGLSTVITGSVHCVGQVLMSKLISLLVLVSTLTLFTMTMERYFGVLHPLRHRTLITKKRILVFYSCGTSLMHVCDCDFIDHFRQSNANNHYFNFNDYFAFLSLHLCTLI